MPKKHVLTREQMRIYASPVRQRIIASLMARGHGSILEIASDMGRRPDTLYHHVRLLLKHGMIIKTGERIAGKNREAVYGPVARQFAADATSTDAAYQLEYARLVRNVLADVSAHYARAYQIKSGRPRLLFETANVRLRDDQIAELNESIARIILQAKETADGEGGRHLFAFVSTPVGKT